MVSCLNNTKSKDTEEAEGVTSEKLPESETDQETQQPLTPEKAAIPEWKIKDSLQQQKAIEYYTNYLRVVYSTRKFKLERSASDFKYESNDEVDLAENIEGGGVSLKYLKVLENEMDWVGVIGYDFYEEYMFTNCFAILPSGNYISSLLIVPAGYDPVLEVYSNKTGAMQEGPFDLFVYSFQGFRGRTFPLYSTTTDQVRHLTGEEQDQVKDVLSYALPHGQYLGGLCEELEIEDALPASNQIDFGENGRLSIKMYQYFTAECYYRIATPGELTIFNTTYTEFGDKEEYVEEFKFPATTIPFNMTQSTEGIQVLIFKSSIQGLLNAGAACREL